MMKPYKTKEKTMDNNERKKMLGGSDISSVLGMNRWKTPLQLWAEKTGELEPKDLSDVEAVQLGVELEDFVARKFEKATGKKVRRDSRTFKYKDSDYMVAHIDRWVVGGELLECKTCSAWKEKEWEGEEIPQEYILQVQWYLGVLGMKKGYIAVLIGGQKFVWKEIDFDESLFNLMLDQAKKFWDMVETKMPPMATTGDKEVLSDLYGIDSDTFVDGTEEEDVLIESRNEIASQIKDLEAKKDGIENQLRQKIGSFTGLSTPKYKVSWKPQKRTYADTSKLKADGLYEQYTKQSESRVLRVSVRK